MTQTIKIPAITADLLKAQATVRRFANFPSPRRDHDMQVVVDILATLNPPIQAALYAVNGKATAFTISEPSTVRAYAEKAEALLEQRDIPQALRVGTVVTATPAGPGAAAYKHVATSTRITLERRPKGEWRLIGAERCEVWPRQAERMAVQISEAAAEAVRKAAMAPFTVRPGGSSAPAATAGIEERLGVAA